MFSGMTAVICTYPLDVVRARLAFQVTGEHRYTGIANAFHTIYLKVVCSLLMDCSLSINLWSVLFSVYFVPAS